MRVIRAVYALFLVLICVSLSAQSIPEPILQMAQLPTYPPIARLSMIQGEVKASFVLDTKGAVISVETTSGAPDLRKATEENIRTWKFQLPRDLYRTEWRYDTTFVYRLSGHDVQPPKTAKLVVTVDSFHDIEIVSDVYKTVVQIN